MKIIELIKLFAITVTATLLPAAAFPEPVGIDQSGLAKRGQFFVGGEYAGPEDNRIMHGQMYVEVLTPKVISKPYPLVLFHGAAQTATNWLMTPDGRKGWADYFVEQGYIVYMVDQPARGRSAWHPGIDGELRMYSAQQLERLFTAPEVLGNWPQAKLHTQWPGTGRIGDPVFDAFYATQVESLKSDVETQELARKAGAALLDRIGPAVLVTHSQSGLLGWVIADARPDLVKGIIAIEPSGPPFHNAREGNPPAREYGVTDIAVAYDPPISSAAELQHEQQAEADAADLIPCTLQQEPARKLANFLKTPVLVMVSEASYHAPYDHCTARYLQQAGVPADFVRLSEKGIRGNGHMMMLEMNNLEIAEMLSGWIEQKVK